MTFLGERIVYTFAHDDPPTAAAGARRYVFTADFNAYTEDAHLTVTQDGQTWGQLEVIAGDEHIVDSEGALLLLLENIDELLGIPLGTWAAEHQPGPTQTNPNQSEPLPPAPCTLPPGEQP